MDLVFVNWTLETIRTMLDGLDRWVEMNIFRHIYVTEEHVRNEGMIGE